MSHPIPARAASGSGAPAADPRYLRGMLQYAGGAMFVRDLDGRYQLVNETFEALVGRPAAEIIGRLPHELFPAELADAVVAADRAVIAGGTAHSGREAGVLADGSCRQFLCHRFPLFDADGSVYAVGGFSTDITELESERLATRAAQLETEARFRAVFDHAPIGQIFSELGGVVSSVNAALAALLGYRPADMLGRTVADFAEPAEFDLIRDDANALLTGTSLTVSAIRRFRHRDGHGVPVRVTSALLRDADGSPRYWVSLVADISDEERARAELETAHRATVRAAGRLRLLHSIAAAANESATVEAAAGLILREVSEHFGWPAAALLHWPAPSPGGDTAEVCRIWWDESGGESPDRQEVDQVVTAIAAGLASDGSDADLLSLPAVAADGERAVELPGAVALAVKTESHLRYTWLFICGNIAGADGGPASDTSEPLDAHGRELLGMLALESAHVVERQAAQQLLRDSEERFRSMFTDSPLAMALSIGTSGRLGAVNAAFCQLLGRTEEELVGRLAAEFAYPEDAHKLDPGPLGALNGSGRRHRFEARLRHASGSPVITAITLTWMNRGDGSSYVMAQVENITARREAEDSLRRQADEDALTGLANRSRLNRTLRENADEAAQVAVLFVDLDGFKLINDSRGHDIGDEVLIAVARRLEHAVRPNDLVARFGGDEFVVLCNDLRDPGSSGQIAQRVEQSLSLPIDTSSGEVRVTASVGIAHGAIRAAHPTELVRRADAAMYHAKRKGKDRSELYDSWLHERSLSRQRTESVLRNALDEDRFVLHYQPILELSGRRIIGFEALVRLTDEAGGLVPPQHFISVAEETGLIVPMGAWVLREACLTIARLRRQTGLPLKVSVNVAPSQVARDDLCDTVGTALAEAGLSEDALAIELTESALIESAGSTLLQLNELRARGVQIALDDFGTGYSSLTYLRTFPVNRLKVDRSFVSGIGSRSGDLAIVRAVLGLARDLGIDCVAEGIETELQYREVLGLGAQYGQGYLFSRPVPAAELLPMLQRDGAAHGFSAEIAS